jgi:hypothetical protein
MNGDTTTHPDREAYLKEKLNALVEQVDEGYGEALLEQMIHRMEMTVREFLAEVDLLVERLKHNAATQEELLGRIRHHDRAIEPSDLPTEGGPGEDLPEWERRLSELEGSAK